MHAAPSHYHHHADLFTCTEHIRWDSRGVHKCLLGIFCRESALNIVSSLDYLIFFAICGVVFVRLANSSHNRFGNLNLFHCCHIFPCLCAWCDCAIICFQFLYSLGKLSFLYCNEDLWYEINDYIMAQWSYFLFALYTTTLSSLCRCIWRYWTSKIHTGTFLLLARQQWWPDREAHC